MTTKEQKTPKIEKQQKKQQSLTEYADQIMMVGGTWEDMADKINKRAEQMGQKQRKNDVADTMDVSPFSYAFRITGFGDRPVKDR